MNCGLFFLEVIPILQFDDLWPKGPRFVQKPPVFKLGTDAVLLAHFTNTSRVARAADLGSGTGVVAILLALRTPELQIDCVDILPEAVALTAENAAHNKVADRISAHHADIRQIRDSLRAGAYDLVVSNPPYFPAGSGYRANTESIADAREESLCTLDDICKAASYLLRWGGRFALVHRPERLGEIIVSMHQHGIEPKRLRLVTKTAERAPNLVLIEGRRGGNPGLEILPPLVLQDDTGGDSPELCEIYHRRDQA